jgi:hypothetical protein
METADLIRWRPRRTASLVLAAVLALTSAAAAQEEEGARPKKGAMTAKSPTSGSKQPTHQKQPTSKGPVSRPGEAKGPKQPKEPKPQGSPEWAQRLKKEFGCSGGDIQCGKNKIIGKCTSMIETLMSCSVPVSGLDDAKAAVKKCQKGGGGSIALWLSLLDAARSKAAVPVVTCVNAKLKKDIDKAVQDQKDREKDKKEKELSEKRAQRQARYDENSRLRGTWDKVASCAGMPPGLLAGVPSNSFCSNRADEIDACMRDLTRQNEILRTAISNKLKNKSIWEKASCKTLEVADEIGGAAEKALDWVQKKLSGRIAGWCLGKIRDKALEHFGLKDLYDTVNDVSKIGTAIIDLWSGQVEKGVDKAADVAIDKLSDFVAKTILKLPLVQGLMQRAAGFAAGLALKAMGWAVKGPLAGWCSAQLLALTPVCPPCGPAAAGCLPGISQIVDWVASSLANEMGKGLLQYESVKKLLSEKLIAPLTKKVYEFVKSRIVHKKG